MRLEIVADEALARRVVFDSRDAPNKETSASYVPSVEEVGIDPNLSKTQVSTDARA